MGTTVTFLTDYATVVLTGDRPDLGPTYDRIVNWYAGMDTDLGFEKRPDAPGAFAPEQVFPDEAIISIEGGKYFGPDRATSLLMRETLGMLYNDGRPYTVIVADDLRTTTREVMVERVDIPWSIHPDFTFSIDMRAADPRRYGPVVATETTLAAPGSGLALPSNEGAGVGLALPSDETPTPDLGLDLGTLGVDGRLTITNDGAVETVSTFVVDPQGGSMPDGFVVVNVTTGQRLTYIGAVDGVTTVTLDGAVRNAFLNNDYPAGRWLQSPEWWAVPPRSSLQVAFLARGPVTGTPRLTALTAPAYY